MVVIFESERRFGEPMYKEMVKSFVGAAKDFGEPHADSTAVRNDWSLVPAYRACDRRPCSLR